MMERDNFKWRGGSREEGTMIIRRLALLLALIGGGTPSFSPKAAEGQIQKSGPHVWPGTGRLQIGFHPLGAQIAFNGFSIGGYKLGLDIAGMVKDFSKVSLWVGGGFNYALDTYICGTAI